MVFQHFQQLWPKYCTNITYGMYNPKEIASYKYITYHPHSTTNGDYNHHEPLLTTIIAMAITSND